MVINYLRATFFQSMILVLLIILSAIFGVLWTNMTNLNAILFKAIYWLYIAYYFAFVYVPYLKNKEKEQGVFNMYKETYIDVAVGVLRSRIDEINHLMRSNDLDDTEQEELHNESTKLHRAINELLSLK